MSSVVVPVAKPVRGYFCNVKGRSSLDCGELVHAVTASKARYRYWSDVRDVLPDLRLIDIDVRSAGTIDESPSFRRNAQYRNIPFATIGMRVKVGDKFGQIVGHNSSANLNVLFDSGEVLNCHPNWCITYYDDAGNVIADFRGAA